MSPADKDFKNAEQALQKGHFAAAIAHLDKLLQLEPDNLRYLSKRGEAHLRNENFEAGLIDYAKVVEADNKNVVALTNFAAALIRCNQQENAREVLEYALELDPKNYDAQINLCNVYQTIGKPEEALRTAFRALELRPTAAVAHNNLGTALGDLNLVEESRQAFITANTLDPKFIPAVINLAQVEIKLGNYPEGTRLYEEVLKLKHISPNQAELVRYYLGYAYLYQGQLGKGWDFYEYGFGQLLPRGALRATRRFRQPRWNGEDLTGKSLLIWREQGLGDEIEFSTCLNDLAASGASVIVETDPRLVSIYQRVYPSFTVRAERIGEDLFSNIDDFDVQCPVGSLPRLFRRTMEDFERPRPLWLADMARADDFRERLAGYRGKKLVGICWRSGLFSIVRNENYTALPDWSEVLSDPEVQFVNLQYGDCEHELTEIENQLGIQILRWPDLDLKNDLEGVIALMSELDCVISVGTAVGSLAGAVGMRCFLLTKKAWMMLGEEKRYPWFPSVMPLLPRTGTHVAERLSDLPSLIHTAIPPQVGGGLK
jgi:tetratricopeptide (TPR) repeat protein